MLNARDLQTYTAAQVASLADVDVYSVRDEGARRQAAAETPGQPPGRGGFADRGAVGQRPAAPRFEPAGAPIRRVPGAIYSVR